VTFPPGAVGSDVLLVVRRLDRRLIDVPPPREGYVAGETLLDIRVTTLDGRPVTMFSERIEVCVRYSQGDLAAANDDPSLLALGRYDAGFSEWELPDRELDADAATICVGTRRLSLWMVFAKISETRVGGGLGLWWIGIGTGIFAALLAGFLFGRRRWVDLSSPRLKQAHGPPPPGPGSLGGEIEDSRPPRPPPPRVDSDAMRVPGPPPPREDRGGISAPIRPPTHEREGSIEDIKPSHGRVDSGRIPAQEPPPVPPVEDTRAVRPPEPSVSQRDVGPTPPTEPTPLPVEPESRRMVETPEGETVIRVQAQFKQVRLRVQQTLWRLDFLESWDGSIPLDIISTLDMATENIKRTPNPSRTMLLSHLDSLASEMEVSLDVGLNRALNSASMAVVAELFEALRACRVAQFIARVAMNDPESLEAGPSLVSFLGKKALQVTFSGELTQVYPRHCTVGGVRVILPTHGKVEGPLLPGVRVSVEGVLGPGAVVFASELRTL